MRFMVVQSFIKVSDIIKIFIYTRNILNIIFPISKTNKIEMYKRRLKHFKKALYTMGYKYGVWYVYTKGFFQQTI
mgnify:CR=1 FL=1